MMRLRARHLGAAAIVLWFVVRGVTGVVEGVAYARGAQHAGQGEFEAALHALAWADSPEDPTAVHWLRAQTRQGQWGLVFDAAGRSGVTDELLVQTQRDYLRTIAISPASGWYWADLAEVYQTLEEMERAEQPISLGAMDESPWTRVGRPGRIAIGFSRMAIARAPHVFGLHDRLATTLIGNHLDEAALAVVREAGRIQPMYYLHPYRDLPFMPDGLIDAFAEGAREGLGNSTRLSRGAYLVALARVEVERGNWAQAETDLREALQLPLHRLHQAEARYYLGYALLQAGDLGDAEEQLQAAREHPNLEISSLNALVTLAERQDRLELALDRLGELRRAEPYALSHTLRYARIARKLGDWDRAEDALNWARITHPEDLTVLEDMVRLYIDSGDLSGSRKILAELERRSGGESAIVQRLHDEISRAAGGS